MHRRNLPLESFQVASPCEASWDEMKGSDRVRFCGQCQKNVYNLSAMSRREAEELIEEREGRMCVRLYKREDGTVLTEDCPVGLRAVRRKVALLVGGVAAALLLIIGWGTAFAVVVLSRISPWQSNQVVVPPPPPQRPPEILIMGEIICPPDHPPIDVPPQIEVPPEEPMPRQQN